MARVKCTLPGAGTLIDDVTFSKSQDGNWVSDEITDAQAAQFARLDGFEIVADAVKTTAKSASKPV